MPTADPVGRLNGITPRTPPRWTRAAALAGVTLAAVFGCYLLAAPFFPGLAVGVSLTAIGLPVHRWLRRRVVLHDTWAAGVSVAVIVLLLIVPLWLVTVQLTVEAQAGARVVQENTAGGQWRVRLAEVPYLNDWVAQLEAQNLSLEQEARTLVAQLGRSTVGMVQTAAGVTLQLLIALFVAFYCFRDHRLLMEGVRGYMPLDRADADRVLGRIDGAIHATVYGTLLTGVLQGVTGGLLFWLLGLPAPVLWGVVMTVLSILPVVGAVLVWAPAAVFLVVDERYGAAVALVTWGTLMAGPVCNYVYAEVAANRMRLHPVPALIAFIGGLAVFGVAGMVLGPALLSAAVALLDVWRERASPTQPALVT